MNIDDLTLGQIKQLQSLLGSTKVQESDELVGKYVVVRTYSAGVHFGILKSRNGKECVLTEARRLWSWSGANTLHEVANNGVSSGSKVSEVNQLVALTEAVEFILCPEKGEKNLRASTWQK